MLVLAQQDETAPVDLQPSCGMEDKILSVPAYSSDTLSICTFCAKSFIVCHKHFTCIRHQTALCRQHSSLDWVLGRDGRALGLE